MKRELRLQPVPASVRAARQFVTELLADYPPEAVDQVALMVSELVTNSIVHSGTEFTVVLTVTGPTIRLDVSDEGPGRPRMGAVPEPTDPHGRGLRIVDQLATAWGIDESAGATGKRTWFQLHVSAAL